MFTRVFDVTKTTQTLFSESRLATFDGTKEHMGIYLAVRIASYFCPMCLDACSSLTHGNCMWQIDHDVYDVSSNRRTYGPGGSYAFMCAYFHSFHVCTEYRHHRSSCLAGIAT